MFRDIILYNHSVSVVNEIKWKEIRTVIITNSCQIRTNELIEWFGIDFAFANNLLTDGGIVTRVLIFYKINLIERGTGCRIHSICKIWFLEYLCNRLMIPTNEIIAVGDESIDSFLLEKTELGIAFNASWDVQNHSWS